MIEKLVAELEDRQKIHVEQGTGLPPDAYERVRSVLWSAITESVPREAAKSKLNSNEERLVFDRDMLPESQAQFVRRLLKDWRVRFTKYERPLYIYGLLSVLWKLFPGGRHPFEDVVWLIGTEFRYEPNAKIKRDPETGSCAIIVDVDIISRLQTFSMAIADILLRNKLIDFYRVPTREGIWPSIKLTAKTASFVTSNDYHSRHILYHALLNCALGERYLILMEGSNGAFALARKIFLNGLAFVIAHEFGHDAFGHLLPHPPKARGSFRDTPLFRTAFDEAELLRKCDEATGGHGSTVLRRYLNTTFNSNIKELDADGLALHACFHWEWSIGRDPYIGLLGAMLVHHMMAWLDIISFFETTGLDYTILASTPFLCEALIPRDHPYGPTRLKMAGALLHHYSVLYSLCEDRNNLGGRFDSWYNHAEMVEIMSGLIILFSLARKAAFPEALKRRKSPSEETVFIDERGSKKLPSIEYRGRDFWGSWRS